MAGMDLAGLHRCGADFCAISGHGTPRRSIMSCIYTSGASGGKWTK